MNRSLALLVCLFLAAPSFAVCGELRDDGASGIAQTQELRHFVEGLSGSVVPRLSHDLIGAMPTHQDKLRVSAGDDKVKDGEDDGRWAVGDREGAVLNFRF